MSVPNLNLFGPMKTELWAKEVGEFSIIRENGLVGTLAYQHGCCNVNVWRFSKLLPAANLAFLVYRPEIYSNLSKQGYLHCVKFL